MGWVVGFEVDRVDVIQLREVVEVPRLQHPLQAVPGLGSLTHVATPWSWEPAPRRTSPKRLWPPMIVPRDLRPQRVGPQVAKWAQRTAHVTSQPPTGPRYPSTRTITAHHRPPARPSPVQQPATRPRGHHPTCPR